MRKRREFLNLFFAFVLIFALLATIPGCGDDDDDDSGGASDDDDDDDDDNDDNDDNDDDDNDDDNDNDDNDDNDDDIYWKPSTVAPIEVHPIVRDQEVIRGIIHLHSVYSHDACDNFPFIDGHPNWMCFNQLREAFCTTNQQYIMLTDHKDPFSYNEFPEVLLYQEDEGDELIYNGDDPIANKITCEDGNTLFLMAGNENRIMPVGIEHMPEGTGAERETYFGRSDAAVVESMQNDLGATVFVNHSEDWTTEELAAIPIDGIEVYNLHANIDPGGIVAPSLVQLIWDVLNFIFPLEETGHADLLLLTFLMENDLSIGHWDKLLDLRRTVGIMATDAHRNSLPFPLTDGDRADSYRRMMRWFANYLLVDDFELADIRQAIAVGRLYGAFQVFGEPVGFDFYGEAGPDTYEMGEEVTFTAGLTLHVSVPEFWNMNPNLPDPEFKLQLIKAGEEGGAVVAEGTDSNITYTVTQAGVYRAQVRVTPYHLEPFLGDNADDFIKEFPLIYANPIYVVGD